MWTAEGEDVGDGVGGKAVQLVSRRLVEAQLARGIPEAAEQVRKEFRVDVDDDDLPPAPWTSACRPPGWPCVAILATPGTRERRPSLCAPARWWATPFLRWGLPSGQSCQQLPVPPGCPSIGCGCQ